jgi:hypothetical protein
MPARPAWSPEGCTVKLVLLIIAATAAVVVWRSRRGVEVWHTAADPANP